MLRRESSPVHLSVAGGGQGGFHDDKVAEDFAARGNQLVVERFRITMLWHPFAI